MDKVMEWLLGLLGVLYLINIIIGLLNWNTKKEPDDEM
jgi:hypothetical protein